jgi:hypothetical protein
MAFRKNLLVPTSRVTQSNKNCLALEDGPIGYPETSVTNYKSTLRKIREERALIDVFWLCIKLYDYSETNVMYVLFILLRIKGLYMFRALFTHPQEVLHKRHLIYCVRVMSVGCTRIEAEASILVQPTGITRTQYTKGRLFSVSWGWVSNARNTLRPWILNKLNKMQYVSSLCW